MTHPARKPQATPAMEYGVVSRRRAPQTPEYEVRTDNGHYTARRAKSCLLAPEEGDSVLLCTDDLGACYILAVLEGAQAGGSIEHQGDLSLQVTGGSLSLAAQQGIDIAADSVGITARAGRIALQNLSLLAEAVEGQCRTLALAADACQQSLRSLTQRLGSLFRITEGHEEVQAGSARTLVEDTHVLHCKNSVVMAEEDARIDAEQIQLG